MSSYGAAAAANRGHIGDVCRLYNYNVQHAAHVGLTAQIRFYRATLC